MAAVVLAAGGASASAAATSAAPTTSAAASASASFAPSTAPGGVVVAVSAPQVRLAGACVLYLDPVATPSARSTDCAVSPEGLTGTITVPFGLAETTHPVEAVVARPANLAVFVAPTTVQLGAIVVPSPTLTAGPSAVKPRSAVGVDGSGFNVGKGGCTLTLLDVITRCTVDPTGRLTGSVTTGAGGDHEVVEARWTIDTVPQSAAATLTVLAAPTTHAPSTSTSQSSPPPPTSAAPTTATPTTAAPTTAAATSTPTPTPTPVPPCVTRCWPPWPPTVVVVGVAVGVVAAAATGAVLFAARRPHWLFRPVPVVETRLRRRPVGPPQLAQARSTRAHSIQLRLRDLRRPPLLPRPHRETT
ncbi:hypothetical protein acdb102_30420 [Acidothermaceae bacterium B102]|nr:hypothetical protein acdb102_30420 [Acidothermaceae bacterium B102]